MHDVTVQLRMYADALEGELSRDDHNHQRRSRRGFSLVAATVAMGALLVGAILWLGREQSSVVTTAGSHEVPVPGRGVSAEVLEDGTPVWVVRHADATVSVLDAVSSHRPWGAGNLVAWCPSSGWFEDPASGSSFDEWGRVRSGPAPAGLATFVVRDEQQDLVIVAGPPMLQPRRDAAGSRPPPLGPDCFAEGASGRLHHSLGDQSPVSVQEVVSVPEGEVVYVRATPILLRRDALAVVCATGIEETDPPHCEGPTVVGLDLGSARWAVLHGSFVARGEGGALIFIGFVDLDTVDSNLR